MKLSEKKKLAKSILDELTANLKQIDTKLYTNEEGNIDFEKFDKLQDVISVKEQLKCHEIERAFLLKYFMVAGFTLRY